MKEKLTLLFICMLVLASAQDGCQQSRLNRIQTGEIILNPNDLGTAGANKNYVESLSRGGFGATDLLSSAVAIAGFETSCSQTFFSLVVDIVEPINENTKLRMVIDFRNRAQSVLTTWTKVKLTYLVASAQRYPQGITDTAYVWSTSQYIAVPDAGLTSVPIFTDPVFLGTTAADLVPGQGCGLKFDTGASKFRYGIQCDADGTDQAVDFDVAIHTYIMGFHYEPTSVGNRQLAATVQYGSWSTEEQRLQLAFWTDGTSRTAMGTAYTAANGGARAYNIDFVYNTDAGGPIYTVSSQDRQLKGIKIAVVMSIVNPVNTDGNNNWFAPDNAFGATQLSYSYSGLYTSVSPTKLNVKSPIETNPFTGYNNLHERLPVVKYAIYGFSSFALKDGSGCTSFSLDINLDSVNSYTISTNQASNVESIVIQSDQYFPQIEGVCTPGVEFTDLKVASVGPGNDVATGLFAITDSTELGNARSTTNNYANIKHIKTRFTEKYETVPSDNTYQWIRQIKDNPLSLAFYIKGKKGATGAVPSEYVRLNAEIIMNGLTAGKSYGIHYLFTPQIQDSPAVTAFPEPADKGSYQFAVSVNGFKIVQDSYKNTDLSTIFTTITTRYVERFYGVNIAGNTGSFVFNVTVPRPVSSDTIEHRYQLIVELFELQQVYDPSTQCCVGQCPVQNGLDVSVTPAACVACDTSKGLTFDPSTSSCSCASGFYLSSELLYQCYPCETKLCATCKISNPKVCQVCIAGASLSIFDSTCSCSNGFFENNGTCTKCPTRCATCSVASTCNACADIRRDIANNCSCIAGFYDAGVDKCATCSPSCATCSSATTCTSCDATKFRTLNNTLCVCQEGYFELIFENGTRVCTPCSKQCKTCSQSALECTSCDSAVNRIQGYDSLSHRTCICRPGYFAVANGGCVQSNCKADKWCSQCETDLALCIQCQANVNRVIKLPEHICVCADGFYEGTNGSCVPCLSGCAKCSSATKCDSCVAQASNNGDGTCKCAVGTFFGVATNGVRYCQQCIQYCDVCNNALTCQTCKQGFILSVDNTCVCPKNNFINLKGECVPCKAGCEACLTNTTCEKCITPLVLQENNCIQKCSSGFYLSGAKCIGCPNNCIGCTSNNQCFYCRDGFFLYGGSCYTTCPAGSVANKESFQCVPCNSPCKTCANHPSSCTSCETGEGFLQITGNDQKCVKQCAEGTFPKDGVCQVCDFRCAKCLGSATNCIACPTGRFLFNAACWDYCPGIVDGEGRCVNECPAGYFRMSNQECKQCSTECKTCSNNSTCLTCANNFVSLNGKCVRECGNGYYTFRGQCVACDKSCKTCVNNPLQCTSCADEFISSNGRCVSSCSSGQYLDTVSKTCRACASTCATCSSERNCLTCPNSKIVPVGGQCLACIYPCDTCEQDLSTCKSCQSGFYLSNKDCVRTCPSGTRPVNGVCSCGSGIFLDGACVDSCPTGFTKVGSSCSRCQSPCTECSGSASFCIDCLDTFTLRPNTGKCEQSSICNYGQVEDNGKCVRICDIGLFYQNGACIFGGCPSGFKDNGFGGCVSNTVSTGRCDSPTFRLNGSCVDNCGNNFFPNANTRTCDACSSNCQSCLNSNYCLTCATGFASVDGRCVAQSRCPASQFSFNSACVASCPSGTYSSNGRCVRSCPSGSFSFGNFCYETCPTQAKLFTDNACVATCPTGTTVVDGVCATIV